MKSCDSPNKLVGLGEGYWETAKATLPIILKLLLGQLPIPVIGRLVEMLLGMEDIGRFGMYGTSVVLCLVIFVRVCSIMRDSMCPLTMPCGKLVC